MQSAHKRRKVVRRIEWNSHNVQAVYARHKSARYPAKARMIKTAMDKFKRVSLKDIEERVLREMRNKYHLSDFSDEFELEPELEPELDVAEAPLCRKNPKRVAQGKLTQYKRLRKKHDKRLEHEGAHKEHIKRLEHELAAERKYTNELKAELAAVKRDVDQYQRMESLDSCVDIIIDALQNTALWSRPVCVGKSTTIAGGSGVGRMACS